jgi:hypothetical protein
MTLGRQMSRRPFHPRGPAAGRYELAITESAADNSPGGVYHRKSPDSFLGRPPRFGRVDYL